MSGGLAALGWATLRLFGLLRMQVLWRAAIGPVWEAIAAVLAVCLAAVLVAPAVGPVSVGGWIVVAACELLLGSAIGGLLSLPGAALLGAASHGAGLLQAPRVRGLPLLLAVACLAGGLAAGVHRPLLVALRELLMLWPVGAPTRWLPGLADAPQWLAASAHAALTVALILATPVLLTAATVDLSLRLGARGAAAPTLEVLRPWLICAAALVALGAAWAAYPEAWLRAWPTPP